MSTKNDRFRHRSLHSVSGLWSGGFTLVELLIALAVFTFLIIPIVNLMDTISSMGARSKNEIVAAGLATRRMEEFKCTPYPRLRDYLDSLGGAFDSGLVAIPGFSDYQERVEVTYYPNKEPLNLEDKYRIGIKITIQWENKRIRKVRQHVMFTVITRKAAFI